MKLLARITKLFNKTTLKDGNQIIGDQKLVNSKIIFEGKNNVFFSPHKVWLLDSTIRFHGNNSVVFMCSTGTFNLRLYNDSAFYLGVESGIIQQQHIMAAERKHIIIGNDCIFAGGISLYTSDSHAIHDCEDKGRMNQGKSLYIGDHVWVGSQATLLKGTCVSSGSIIAAGSILSNKTVLSNCCFAGNPAKLIKKNVCFTRECVHGYSAEKLAEIDNGDFAAENAIFQHDASVYLPFDEIDSKLDSIDKPMERIDYLRTALYENQNENRFAL